MISRKNIVRIIVWSFVVLCVASFTFLYFFGDINKLKKSVEQNLKEQLKCTIKLGDLDWDFDGLQLGVTTKEISIFDNENNIILQSGQTRFVWHLKNLITGTLSHFYTIESSNLYLNAVRYKNGVWNIVKIFPPGPPPKVDNLELHNSIVFLEDKANLGSQSVLCKDLNLQWKKKIFSELRNVDLVTRVSSLENQSFLKVKGTYSEQKRFQWNKSMFNLRIIAKEIDLSKFQSYIASFIKDLQIKKIGGQFNGFVYLKKARNKKIIEVISKTNTDEFLLEFQNKDITQLVEIPKTDFILKASVGKNKIYLKSFKSHVDELVYKLSGTIFNWSSNLPDIDLDLKTNKFNFKKVKPYLPLSLLPADARNRIEPINDEGLVELNVKLKGALIEPKYYGTITLEDFNLTSESGFLYVISDLDAKLVLDEDILKVNYLKIPIEGSPLYLTGEINNKNQKTKVNISGSKLNVQVLQSLLYQVAPQAPLLNEIVSGGKLDLNLDILTTLNTLPEIKGKLAFYDASCSLIKEELLEIKMFLANFCLMALRWHLISWRD